MTKFSSIAGGFGLALVLAPVIAHAQSTPTTDEQRARIERKLDELKTMRKDLSRTMDDFDARIEALEAEMRVAPPPPPAKRKAALPKPAATKRQPASAAVDSSLRPTVEDPPPPVIREAAATPPAPPPPDDGSIDVGFGKLTPGKGILIASWDEGELGIGLITYSRYLNQLGLDRTYTDAFGRTFILDLRQDVQFAKANLSFKGWLIDPDFTYRVWIWTQGAQQGQGAQLVLGGHTSYRFSDMLQLSVGIGPLPSNRTTNWTYPAWLKMDNRTIADEFFRASYTTGFWIDGKLTEGLEYRAMIANNLSTLGVDAGQLDADFSTVSGALWWMPTTGEYGPLNGFGDYEDHQEVATQFGIHYTRSREDQQSQPNTDTFENTQIRLSDGTPIFGPDPFNTGGEIDKATYQMVAANAGFKYHGWSLEAEYYWRWVDEFKTQGFIPVDNLYDHGVGVQGSVMVIPSELQIYAAGSTVFGEYGDPWDLTIGTNWYPFARREVRVNAQGIYLDRSPIGGLSYPYALGGTGWVFNADFIIAF